MNREVYLEFIDGNFAKGFTVRLEVFHISNNGNKFLALKSSGKLPPNNFIPETLKQYQEKYHALLDIYRFRKNRIKIDPEQITNVSIDECQEQGQRLLEGLNEWVKANEFETLKSKLQKALVGQGEVDIIIQSDREETILQSLPWHASLLFQDLNTRAHYRGEISYGQTDFFVQETNIQLKSPVKILAVIGDSEGINTEEDINYLKNIINADIEFLEREKATKTNIRDYLYKGKFEILFFAGHSGLRDKDKKTVLELDNNEKVDIDWLKESLQTAINNGLKIAIFNSCQCLELAKQLTSLNIPQVIVMRQLVPDKVAQTFLKYFLQAFAGERKSFTLAFKQAREKLNQFDEEFSHPTWVPVLWKNPAIGSPIWPKLSLIHKLNDFLKKLPKKKFWLLIFLFGSFGSIFIDKYFIHLDSIVTKRSSYGEKKILQSPPQVANLNQQAAKAFKEKNYDMAIQKWDESLSKIKNQPEILIYLNNARCKQQSKYLTLATSMPLGNNPNTASEILRGIAQGQKEINNAPSQNNKCLLILIANDNNNEQLARENAKFFVKTPEILAVIGHHASNISKSVADIYENNKLVMIAPTSMAMELTMNKKYIFRTSISGVYILEELTEQILNRDKRKKLLICHDSRSEGNSFYNGLINVLLSKRPNSVINLSQDCIIDRPNFQPNIIEKAIAQNADGLIILPHIDRLELAIKIAEINRGRLQMYGSTAMYSQQIFSQEGSYFNNLIVPVPWISCDKPQDTSCKDIFAKKAFQLWGAKVCWRTATSYDAIMTINTALKQSSTREGLQQVLNKRNFIAYGTGEIKFLSGDRTNIRTILVQVRPDDKGFYNFVRLK